MKIKIGTRESMLAMAQTNIVINELKSLYPNIRFEIVPIKTKGDKILNMSLNKIGGKGLFVNELEKELINKTIDIAVHSMKDMPIKIGEGLEIAAYSKREDVHDALISLKYKTINEMPQNSILGTSSLRRSLQALKLNPNLDIKSLRGNIVTRLNKLENGEYDSIILAMAGLKRLNLESKAVYKFSTNELVPGICQGIIGIETRQDTKILDIVSKLDNKVSRYCALAERGFMKVLDGSCNTPMGAYAKITDNELTIKGFYKYSDIIKITGKIEDAEELGIELGAKLKGNMAI